MQTATQTITFSTSGQTVTHECSFDGGTWVSCSSPYTTPTLTPVSTCSACAARTPRGNRGAESARSFKSQVLTLPAGVATPTTVPLTTDATLGAAKDWIHWTASTSTGFDRMNATQRISTWSTLGTAGNTGTITGASTFN